MAKKLVVVGCKPTMGVFSKLIKGELVSDEGSELVLTGVYQLVTYPDQSGKPKTQGSNLDGVTTKMKVRINLANSLYHSIVGPEHEEAWRSYNQELMQLRALESGLVTPGRG